VLPGSDGSTSGSDALDGAGARDGAPQPFDAGAEKVADGSDASRNGGPTDAPLIGDVSSDVPAASPFVVVIVGVSPTVELRATTSVQVRVDPQGNQGSVVLSVADLPVGVTGAFTPSTIALDGVNSAMSRLDLTTLSTAAAGAVPFRVIAAIGATTHEAAASLTVQFAITFTIPAGATSRTGMDKTTFGAYPTIVNAPASFPTPPLMVRFYNADPTLSLSIEGHDTDFPGEAPPGAPPMTTDSFVRMPAMKNHPYSFEIHQNETCCAGELLIQ
jgi:hypothetical protein